MLYAVKIWAKTFCHSNVGNRSRQSPNPLILNHSFVKTTILPFQLLASRTVHQQETIQIFSLKAVFIVAVAITSYTEIRTIIADGTDTLIIRSIANDYRWVGKCAHANTRNFTLTDSSVV